MLTIDVNEGITTDVSHTRTAIHIVQVAGIHGDGGIACQVAGIAAAVDTTTNLYLPLRHNRGQEYQNRYDGYSLHHLYLIYQLSITNDHRRVVQIGLGEHVDVCGLYRNGVTITVAACCRGI